MLYDTVSRCFTLFTIVKFHIVGCLNSLDSADCFTMITAVLMHTKRTISEQFSQETSTPQLHMYKGQLRYGECSFANYRLECL